MESPEPVESCGDGPEDKQGWIEEETPTVRLADSIEVSQLREGATFEVLEEPGQETIDTSYRPEEIYDHLNPSEINCGGGDDDDEDDEITHFEKLSTTMTAITGDRGVLKKVHHQGFGEKVPEAAFVQIHLNAYLEDEDAPYDSTRIRDKPQRFRLGKEGDAMRDVIPGLDIAVSTMHKNERSWFLISPEYAYGPMGCPPRIPENATLLYDIELLGFTETMGFDEYFSMSAAQRREAPFELVSKVVEKERKDGNDMYKSGYRTGAIRKYKAAVHRLQDCRLRDADEETQRNKLLIKTSLNLGLCYMKEKSPKPCLRAVKEAIHLDSNNAKGHYLRGKAYIQLAQFGEAKKALQKARELKPRDPDISSAFEELERKLNKYNTDERRLCQAMMGMKADGKAPNHDSIRAPYTEEEKAAIREYLVEFVEDSELQEMPLRLSTPGEIRCVKDVAAEFNVQVNQVGEGSNLHYRLCKPNVEELQ